MTETFHRRGHHVQSAHGRRHSLANDNDHTSGGMIALMPTAEDAKRLALPGGEAAAELHCTLFFLGDDGAAWTEEQRNELETDLRALVALYELEPLDARVFGVAHWNGGSDNPSWVWNVGDAEPGESSPHCGLKKARACVTEALESTHERPELPPQHSPWAAHICAAYTGDLTLTRALEKRLGPVTFDRIRLSFGDDDRDIPLTGGEALTAAALRRDPLPHEEACDFAEHNRQWEGAVASASSRLMHEMADWRAQIREQITAGADTPEELASLTVETSDAEAVLTEAMVSLAERAGQSLVREAAKQGVVIDDWSLPEDAVTAAVGGRRLLGSVARMTADLMATSVVQSAKRVVTGLFARDATPEAVAAEVDRALQEGQDSLVRSQVGTAMSTAQTAGRQAVLEAAPPGEYYASEMLDRNTCGPCKAVDGEQFGSLEIAIKAYPVMGYKDCVGPRYGNSCRGMIVARWTPEADEETEPVTAAGDAHPFHGTPGRPSYRKYHPSGRNKKADRGLRKLPGGGVLGSDRFSEEEHLNAVTSYNGTGFRQMNGLLRTGEGDDRVRRDNSALMDLIDVQEPSTGTTRVYRGMRAPRRPAFILNVGDEFHDRGFLSTSSEERIGRSFAGDDEKSVMFTLVLPPGSRYVDLNRVREMNQAEREIILPPGLKFRVRRILSDDREEPGDSGPIHYELEVVRV